jgi:hypothetical protein
MKTANQLKEENELAQPKQLWAICGQRNALK